MLIALHSVFVSVSLFVAVVSVGSSVAPPSSVLYVSLLFCLSVPSFWFYPLLLVICLSVMPCFSLDCYAISLLLYLYDCRVHALSFLVSVFVSWESCLSISFDCFSIYLSRPLASLAPDEPSLPPCPILSTRNTETEGDRKMQRDRTPRHQNRKKDRKQLESSAPLVAVPYRLAYSRGLVLILRALLWIDERLECT